MRRYRWSVRTMLVATAVVAVCFASFGLFSGGILAVSLLLVVLDPHPFRWRTLERGVTVAWLLGVGLIASDVEVDSIGVACFFLPTGLLLSFTWLVRQAREYDKVQVRQDWAQLLLTPASCLLALVLLGTDLDFQLRLALSEPVLRAEARRIPRGFHDRWWPAQHSGLFNIYAVEERDGCVLWDTGGNSLSFWTIEGLAYLPDRRPPLWAGYTFQHVRGPWWKFVQNLD